jgi:hypothetical protein
MKLQIGDRVRLNRKCAKWYLTHLDVFKCDGDIVGTHYPEIVALAEIYFDGLQLTEVVVGHGNDESFLIRFDDSRLDTWYVNPEHLIKRVKRCKTCGK